MRRQEFGLLETGTAGRLGMPVSRGRHQSVTVTVVAKTGFLFRQAG